MGESKNLIPNQQVGQWLVMDGRARFDTDDAVVLEALGEGRRDQVPARAARQCWQDQDAVLCFSPPTEERGVYGVPEYVQDVDAIGDIERPQPSPLKVNCPTCGKRVKQAGLHNHMRDVHKP